jgi:hypothetical protein
MGEQIEKDENDRACRMDYGRRNSCFGGQTCRKEATCET